MTTKKRKANKPKLILSEAEATAHRSSMQCTDSLVKMADQRIRLVAKLKAEHATLTRILEIAMGDLRSIAAALAQQAASIEVDARKLVQRATDAGELELADNIRRSIETMNLAPWNKFGKADDGK